MSDGCSRAAQAPGLHSSPESPVPGWCADVALWLRRLLLTALLLVGGWVAFAGTTGVARADDDTSAPCAVVTDAIPVLDPAARADGDPLAAVPAVGCTVVPDALPVADPPAPDAPVPESAPATPPSPVDLPPVLPVVTEIPPAVVPDPAPVAAAPETTEMAPPAPAAVAPHTVVPRAAPISSVVLPPSPSPTSQVTPPATTAAAPTTPTPPPAAPHPPPDLPSPAPAPACPSAASFAGAVGCGTGQGPYGYADHAVLGSRSAALFDADHVQPGTASGCQAVGGTADPGTRPG